MRSSGNFYSERGHGQPLLISLVGTAVGATASAAVIFSLVGSPPTQSDVLSISPRPIVRDIGASVAKETVKYQPAAEIPLAPTGTNEVATQTEAEHQPELSKQGSRMHKRVVVTRSRESYWRGRFARAFSQPRFSSW
jgi:hypothetical protein